MEIGIRLHDTAGSNLEEHLRNAKKQGFSCVHIAMSKVVPGFKMADAPELLTDALADEVRGSSMPSIPGRFKSKTIRS